MLNLASAFLFLGTALGAATVPVPDQANESPGQHHAVQHVADESDTPVPAKPAATTRARAVDRTCDAEVWRQARTLPRRRAPTSADCHRGLAPPLSVWEQELLRQHRQFHDLHPAWR